MYYLLHNKYSEKSLIQAVDNKIIYQNTTTRVVGNNQNLSLLGEFTVCYLSTHNTKGNCFTAPTSLRAFLSSNSLAGSLLIPDDLVAKLSISESLLEDFTSNSNISDALYAKLNNIHIFGRNEPTDDFFYLGNSNLCGIGFSKNTWQLSYELQVKLSRDLWRYFGGYKGWLVCINSQQVEIATSDEIAKLIENLSQTPEFSLQIVRYDGDMLQAGINKTNGAFLSYSSVDGKQFFSGTYESNGEWITFDRFNDAFEVPASTLIPRVEAMKLIESFLFLGEPPSLGEPK